VVANATSASCRPITDPTGFDGELRTTFVRGVTSCSQTCRVLVPGSRWSAVVDLANVLQVRDHRVIWAATRSSKDLVAGFQQFLKYGKIGPERAPRDTTT
jgi:hypothetical protein